MGNSGLGHPQQRRDVAHAHLCLKEHIQDTDAGGITEDPEQFCQVIQGIFPWHLLLYSLYDLIVGMHEFTALHVVAVLHDWPPFA